MRCGETPAAVVDDEGIWLMLEPVPVKPVARPLDGATARSEWGPLSTIWTRSCGTYFSAPGRDAPSSAESFCPAETVVWPVFPDDPVISADPSRTMTST